MAERIKHNRARCLKCGSIIESKHHRDFVTCECGNVSVDGGHFYLKRAAVDLSAFEEMSEFEEVPEKEGQYEPEQSDRIGKGTTEALLSGEVRRFHVPQSRWV